MARKAWGIKRNYLTTIGAGVSVHLSRWFGALFTTSPDALGHDYLCILVWHPAHSVYDGSRCLGYSSFSIRYR